MDGCGCGGHVHALRTAPSACGAILSRAIYLCAGFESRRGTAAAPTPGISARPAARDSLSRKNHLRVAVARVLADSNPSRTTRPTRDAGAGGEAGRAGGRRGLGDLLREVREITAGRGAGLLRAGERRRGGGVTGRK